MNKKVGLWYVESWEYDCVCLSAVRLAVCVKQKDPKQTKQTAPKGCIYMLFSFLLLLFSLSPVTNLALSSPKLQVGVVTIVVMAYGILLFHSISLISLLYGLLQNAATQNSPSTLGPILLRAEHNTCILGLRIFLCLQSHPSCKDCTNLL